MAKKATRELILSWTAANAKMPTDVQFEAELEEGEESLLRILQIIAGLTNKGGGRIVFGISKPEVLNGERKIELS